MRNINKIICALFFLLTCNFQGAFSNGNSIIDTVKNVTKKPLRIYHTDHIFSGKPVIDGKLDDACWKTGVWLGNYTQWIQLKKNMVVNK
jgi:hypothetical protein